MCAEGYLTLAKLDTSECWKMPNGKPDWGRIFHLCGDDIPRFEVEEPVAIYPARATVFGIPAIIPQIHIGYSHTNLRTDCAAVNELAEHGRGRLVTLWNRKKIVIGLAIVSQAGLGRWLTAASPPNVWVDPGSVPIDEAREAWSKITPGVWMVKQYREHPATAERCMTYETPPHCKLGEEVEWMLWT